MQARFVYLTPTPSCSRDLSSRSPHDLLGYKRALAPKIALLTLYDTILMVLSSARALHIFLQNLQITPHF